MGYGGIIGQQPDLSSALTKDEASGLYLTKTEANTNYLSKNEASQNFATKSEISNIIIPRCNKYSYTFGSNNSMFFWNQNEYRPLPYKLIFLFTNINSSPYPIRWEQSKFTFSQNVSYTMFKSGTSSSGSATNFNMGIEFIVTRDIGGNLYFDKIVSGEQHQNIQVTKMKQQSAGSDLFAPREANMSFQFVMPNGKATGNLDIYWYY